MWAGSVFWAHSSDRHRMHGQSTLILIESVDNMAYSRRKMSNTTHDLCIRDRTTLLMLRPSQIELFSHHVVTFLVFCHMISRSIVSPVWVLGFLCVEKIPGNYFVRTKIKFLSFKWMSFSSKSRPIFLLGQSVQNRTNWTTLVCQCVASLLDDVLFFLSRGWGASCP